MRKIIFFAVIISILGFAAYYICEIFCKDNTTSIHIYAFETSGQASDHEKSTIYGCFNEENKIIKIYLHSPKSISGQEVVLNAPDGISQKDAYRKKFESTVDSMLKSLKNQSVSIEKTNAIFEQFANNMNLEENLSNSKYYIFIGTMPSKDVDCYDKGNAKSLNIKEKIKVKKTDKVNIIWALKTSDKDPEQAIYNEISKLGFKCTYTPIITPTRVPCNLPPNNNLYSIFFDKLDETKAKDFLTYLTNTYGDNLRLTIWNDGVKNNTVVNINKSNLGSDSILKVFGILDKGKWTSIGYLVKQAVNNLSQIKSTENKNLLIVGNFPVESKGSQLDKDTWKLLKSIEKLNLILCKKNSSRENETDKAVKYGFEYFKIKYNESNF